MKISGIKYLLLGIGSFAFSFAVLALVVSHYAPTPVTSDFDHRTEVTGRYHYFRRTRGGGGSTWLDDDRPLNCRVSAVAINSCFGLVKMVPHGTLVTAALVQLKTLYSHASIVMSIRTSNEQIFNQTPAQCIEEWKNENLYWFFAFSSIFSIMITGFTKIVSDYLPMIKAGKLMD